MENNQMLVLLRRQSENLKALLKTIINKRSAIVANVITDIERLTLQEEKLLREINHTEKLRLECLVEYGKDNSLESNSIKLDDYISVISAGLNSQQQKEFADLRTEIKETTKQIMEVNKQVKYVILQSRSMLNEIVIAIFKNKSNSLLDVKV